MNLESALDTIHIALEGYVEDCIGRENEEAQKELDEAWTLILNKVKDIKTKEEIRDNYRKYNGWGY